jgi:two-component system sensor histidine kinase KdpD
MIGYVRSALVLGACTLTGTLVLQWLSITDIAMVHLLGVGIVASWPGTTRRQAIFAAVLSVALFDFFFVPPRFTFAVSDLHYILTFAVMLATALVISRLAQRVRAEARAAEERDRGTAALYPMTGDLLEAKTLDDVITVTSRHLQDAFDADVRVLLRRDRKLAPVGAAPAGMEVDADLAELVYQSWEAGGRGTKNFPDAPSLYLPLVGSHGRLGVLEIHPHNAVRFREPAVSWLLNTFAAQVALALERVRAVA